MRFPRITHEKPSYSSPRAVARPSDSRAFPSERGTRPGRLRATFAALVLAILLGAAPGHARDIAITILYTTDVHGHIASDEKTIGLDLVATIKKSLPQSVLVDAGDFLHGTPLAGFDKGHSIVRLMREAGYFAAAAGNHEFSHGLPALMDRTAQAAALPAPMHILSANIRGKNGEYLLRPWARTAVGDIAMCFFGVATPETGMQASPAAVAGLTFADPLLTATGMVAELRAAGCDLVIALAHVGSDVHVACPSTSLAAIPGLDAVIDGHSHHELAFMQPGRAPVVSSGAHGEALGQLTLTVDTATKKVVDVRNTLIRPENVAQMAPDSALRNAIATLQESVAHTLAEIVSESPAHLPGDRKSMRTRETALGDLVADAVKNAYGADIAIVNAGSIRAGLPKGPVTRKDITALLPFGGQVVTVTVTGAELWDILEYACGKLPGEDGAFPQVSGTAFTVRPENLPGKRVTDIRIDGIPLASQAEYILATNDFLAQGGDGYPHLARKGRLQSWMSVTDAVIRRLRENGAIPCKPQGRITRAAAAGIGS